jgi:hypothetical protein
VIKELASIPRGDVFHTLMASKAAENATDDIPVLLARYLFECLILEWDVCESHSRYPLPPIELLAREDEYHIAWHRA